MSYFPLGRLGKYINIFEVHLYFFMIYNKISWDIFLFLYILFLMLFVLCARCVIRTAHYCLTLSLGVLSVKTARFSNVISQIKQLRVIFNHLKFWVAVAKHNLLGPVSVSYLSKKCQLCT